MNFINSDVFEILSNCSLINIKDIKLSIKIDNL